MQPIQIPKSENSNLAQPKTAFKKYFIIATAAIGVFFVALILFIKFDTAGAAQFTDTVLRPLIGARQVIALERLFYNSSDALNRLTAADVKQESPLVDATTQKVAIKSAPGLSQSPVMTQAATPLPGEGQWKAVPFKDLISSTVAEQTFIRPDKERSFAYATLIELDMSKLQLFSVAGTKEPGGKVGKPGPGVIPLEVQKSGKLLAAFDGGFQYSDGQYGMIVGKQTYLPLQRDLATLIGSANGKLEILKYAGQPVDADVTFVRQNCPMLIDKGQIGLNNEEDKKLWGRTLTSDIYTWRSGIGLTPNGNLIYAVGNSLTPTTLAIALKAAGAVTAMQLDINPFWVRFSIFDAFKDGNYQSSSLMKGMYNGHQEFLKGDAKDFFYIVKK